MRSAASNEEAIDSTASSISTTTPFLMPLEGTVEKPTTATLPSSGMVAITVATLEVPTSMPVIIRSLAIFDLSQENNSISLNFVLISLNPTSAPRAGQNASLPT